MALPRDKTCAHRDETADGPTCLRGSSSTEAHRCTILRHTFWGPRRSPLAVLDRCQKCTHRGETWSLLRSAERARTCQRLRATANIREPEPILQYARVRAG